LQFERLSDELVELTAFLGLQKQGAFDTAAFDQVADSGGDLCLYLCFAASNRACDPSERGLPELVDTASDV